jgi:hypothetical protein
MKAVKKIAILFFISVIFSVVMSALLIKDANGMEEKPKPTTFMKDPFWYYHAITSEAIMGTNGTLSEPIDVDDILDLPIDIEDIYDLTNPFALLTFIWGNLEDGDDFNQVDVDASIHMNETMLRISFYNVVMVYEKGMVTQRLEVDELTGVFTNDYDDAFGSLGFLANYDIWYKNLTITQKLNLGYDLIDCSSVDTFHVDGMMTSHHYSPVKRP